MNVESLNFNKMNFPKFEPILSEHKSQQPLQIQAINDLASKIEKSTFFTEKSAEILAENMILGSLDLYV